MNSNTKQYSSIFHSKQIKNYYFIEGCLQIAKQPFSYAWELLKEFYNI